MIFGQIYTLWLKISMLPRKVRLTIYPDFVVVRSPVVNAEYVTGHDLKMELIWNDYDCVMTVLSGLSLHPSNAKSIKMQRGVPEV